MDTILLLIIVACLIMILREVSALVKVKQGDAGAKGASADDGAPLHQTLTKLSGQLAYIVSATWEKDERFREDLTEGPEMDWSRVGYQTWDALVKRYGVWDRPRDYEEGGMRTLRGAPTRLEAFFWAHAHDRWPGMREERWMTRRRHVKECIARAIKPQPFVGSGVDPAFDLLQNSPCEFWEAVGGHNPYGPHPDVAAMANGTAVALLAEAIKPRLDKTSEGYLAVFAGERGEGTGLAHAPARVKADKMPLDWEAHVSFDIFLDNVTKLEDSIGEELAMNETVQEVGQHCGLTAHQTAFVVLDLSRTWAAGLKFAGWTTLMSFLDETRAATESQGVGK